MTATTDTAIANAWRTCTDCGGDLFGVDRTGNTCTACLRKRTEPAPLDYDDLSDSAREIALIIENTEPLYLDLCRVARRILNRRTERPTEPRAYGRRRYRHPVNLIVTDATHEYRRLTGEPIRIKKADRATLITFLLELAEQYADDMERSPDTFRTV